MTKIAPHLDDIDATLARLQARWAADYAAHEAKYAAEHRDEIEAERREDDRREADRIRRLLADDAKAESATVKPPRRKKRRPDFVQQTKRATAAGLNVTAVTITADSVVMTLGETEVPAPIDASVIETAEELRGLI